MISLRFMGLDEPETFRCRVYAEGPASDANNAARAFVAKLATDGWIETVDGDPRHGAIQALLDRGWVVSRFERAKDHGLAETGRVKVWSLSGRGRKALLP